MFYPDFYDPIISFKQSKFNKTQTFLKATNYLTFIYASSIVKSKCHLKITYCNYTQFE